MTRQNVPPLKEVFILNQLEELAEKLGIAVRYENVNVEESAGTGGLCRIKGQYVLIVHSHTTSKEKIQIITAALKGFDLGDIYLKPVIRELLEGSVE